MSENHLIDYPKFQERLVEALRSAWTEIRQQRPTETFYLFGLETDSDLTDLNLFCNTNEEAKSDQDDYTIERWFYEIEESPLYRAGKEQIEPLARELNGYVYEDHSDDPPEAFQQRKKTLLQVFENALFALDRESFFAPEQERSNVLLMIQFTDPDDAEWDYTIEAVKRLNPESAYQPFMDAIEVVEQLQEMDDERQEEMISIAQEFLKKEGKEFQDTLTAAPILNPAIRKQLLQLLPNSPPDTSIWQVMFSKPGASDQPTIDNTLMVIVEESTGKCALIAL